MSTVQLPSYIPGGDNSKLLVKTQIHSLSPFTAPQCLLIAPSTPSSLATRRLSGTVSNLIRINNINLNC